MLTDRDRQALAGEFLAARESGQMISVPPSARESGFDLYAAYAVEQELAGLRAAKGHKPVGYKVGYANKSIWPALKLDTVAWAHMYKDTVFDANDNEASLSLARTRAPKIEPEIVFKMKRALDGTTLDPAAVLDAVEWIALGFELVDCPFADAKFQPADFIAAFGFHAALVIGTPRPIQSSGVPPLFEQLATFTVRLSKDGQLVAEGSAKNVLRSPALCLMELASGMARRQAATLAAGDLVSSGSLADAQPVAHGETWTAVVEGIDLPPLTVRTIA